MAIIKIKILGLSNAQWNFHFLNIETKRHRYTSIFSLINLTEIVYISHAPYSYQIKNKLATFTKQPYYSLRCMYRTYGITYSSIAPTYLSLAHAHCVVSR